MRPGSNATGLLQPVYPLLELVLRVFRGSWLVPICLPAALRSTGITPLLRYYGGFASILLGASLAISAALRLTPERQCCQCSARSGLIRCAHPCGAACRQSISAALRFPSSRPSPLLNLLSPTTPCTVVWLPCLDQSTFPELGSDLTSPVANGLVRAQR